MLTSGDCIRKEQDEDVLLMLSDAQSLFLEGLASFSDEVEGLMERPQAVEDMVRKLNEREDRRGGSFV